MKSKRHYLSIFRLILFLLLIGVPSGAMYLVFEAYFQSEKELRQVSYFLENEQFVYRVRDQIAEETSISVLLKNQNKYLSIKKAPLAIVSEADPSKIFFGSIPKTLSKDIKKLRDQENPNALVFAKYQGKIFMLKQIPIATELLFQGIKLPAGYYLGIFEIDRNIFAYRGKDKYAKAFIMNADGDLFSESVEMTQGEAIREPIVQEFVRSSVNRQLITTEDLAGNQVYGFFTAIPNTNLAAFATLPIQRLFSKIFVSLYEALGALILGFIVMLVILRILFAEIKNQVEIILQLMADFKQGYFIPPGPKELPVFGEFEPLVDMVYAVTHKVRERMNELEGIKEDEGIET